MLCGKGFALAKTVYNLNSGIIILRQTGSEIWVENTGKKNNVTTKRTLFPLSFNFDMI